MIIGYLVWMKEQVRQGRLIAYWRSLVFQFDWCYFVCILILTIGVRGLVSGFAVFVGWIRIDLVYGECWFERLIGYRLIIGWFGWEMCRRLCYFGCDDRKIICFLRLFLYFYLFGVLVTILWLILFLFVRLLIFVYGHVLLFRHSVIWLWKISIINYSYV